MVPQRYRLPHGGMALGLGGDQCLAANPVQMALGQPPVGISLDHIEVGFDDLKPEGR
jgi:hypothetical protein